LIISTDADKAFDKTQHHFMIKALTKLGIEGMYLNILKATHHSEWGKIETTSSQVR
jgi:hypothetical protein